MNERLKWQLFLIVVLVGAAGYFLYPSDDKPLFRTGDIFENRKIELGLDLQGGSELRIALKKEGMPETQVRENTDKAKDIIERRINLFGLKEPRIQRFGDDQILIQLPGIDDTELNRVKKIILTSGHLEFKLEADKEIETAYNDKYPQAPAGYTWYERESTRGETDRFDRVLVKDKVELTGEELVKAGTDVGGKGIVVTFKFNLKGAKKLADLTNKYSEENLGERNGRRLAIILDNKLVSAPLIRTSIPDGEGIIEGGFTVQTAQDLATVLRSGSLPASLEIVSETSVGPTLGQDSIKRGIIAFALSIIVVALFMVIYYHGAGLISVIALAMNAILILGILSFFNATLTLPGIAGLVLTMGMAVDSNIIFYERIREELARGLDLKRAFESGFDHALITVVDSNLTTLMAGLILYYFGTGPLKGFAITLNVGIITTLFTAYFATKVLTEISIDSGIIKKFSMFKLLTNPQFKFMSKARMAFTISAIIVILCFGLFLAKGKASYGIDFTGGTVMNVKFQSPVDITYVRDTIQSITATDASGVTTPKYPDAEAQSMLPRLKDKEIKRISFGDIISRARSSSDEYQVRTRFVTTAEAVQEFKADLTRIFAGKIVLDPVINVESIKKRDYRLKMTVQAEQVMKFKDVQDKLKTELDKSGMSEPLVSTAQDGIEEAKVFDVYFKEDNESAIEKIVRKTLGLSEGPFPRVESIGGMVARELQQNAVIAIILSWVGMILYLAIRFEFQYGLAAVVALIHDVLISLGSVIIFNMLVPASWGISLEINLTTVAALLTIAGYSVNDTIVVFDRIRENRKIMKGEPLNKIIDVSVNQTMGRTIITAFSVFLTVTLLFIITAQSGGGIAPFAFPMIIGTIVGAYSTIFIASAMLKTR